MHHPIIQGSTYKAICYTDYGALAGIRNNSMGQSKDVLHNKQMLYNGAMSHFSFGCNIFFHSKDSFKNRIPLILLFLTLVIHFLFT